MPLSYDLKIKDRQFIVHKTERGKITPEVGKTNVKGTETWKSRPPLKPGGGRKD